MSLDVEGCRWVADKFSEAFSVGATGDYMKTFRNKTCRLTVTRGKNHAGEFITISKVENGRVKNVVVPGERGDVGWRTFHSHISGFFRVSTQAPEGVKEGLKSINQGQFNKVKDGGTVLQYFKDWRKAVVVFRNSSALSWREVNRRMEAITRRKCYVYPLVADRGIFWCKNYEEKNYLLKNPTLNCMGENSARLEEWTKESHWDDLMIEVRYSWIGIEGLPLNMWNIHVLKVIGDACGGFLELAEETKNRTFLQYAKIKVKGFENGFMRPVVEILCEGQKVNLGAFSLRGNGSRISGFRSAGVTERSLRSNFVTSPKFGTGEDDAGKGRMQTSNNHSQPMSSGNSTDRTHVSQSWSLPRLLEIDPGSHVERSNRYTPLQDNLVEEEQSVGEISKSENPVSRDYLARDFLKGKGCCLEGQFLSGPSVNGPSDQKKQQSQDVVFPCFTNDAKQHKLRAVSANATCAEPSRRTWKADDSSRRWSVPNRLSKIKPKQSGSFNRGEIQSSLMEFSSALKKRFLGKGGCTLRDKGSPSPSKEESCGRKKFCHIVYPRKTWVRGPWRSAEVIEDLEDSHIDMDSDGELPSVKIPSSPASSQYSESDCEEDSNMQGTINLEGGGILFEENLFDDGKHTDSTIRDLAEIGYGVTTEVPQGMEAKTPEKEYNDGRKWSKEEWQSFLETIDRLGFKMVPKMDSVEVAKGTEVVDQ